MAHVTPINPHPWTIPLGFDRAQLIDSHERMLVCSGQDAVDAGRHDVFGRPELTVDEFHRRLDDGARIVARTTSGGDGAAADAGAIPLFVVGAKGELRRPAGGAAPTIDPGDTVIELIGPS